MLYHVRRGTRVGTGTSPTESADPVHHKLQTQCTQLYLRFYCLAQHSSMRHHLTHTPLTAPDKP